MRNSTNDCFVNESRWQILSNKKNKEKIYIMINNFIHNIFKSDQSQINYFTLDSILTFYILYTQTLTHSNHSL
jgi:hypothetical protein